MRDYLGQGKDMKKALALGFDGAWATVLDSNITGLLVGLTLWWLGVSMVTGFGIMTVLGIVISLFVVKHFCNPLTIWWRMRQHHRTQK